MTILLALLVLSGQLLIIINNELELLDKMKLIYEPKGKAGEFSLLVANFYSRFTNGCPFCYVPPATRTDKIILTYLI